MTGNYSQMENSSTDADNGTLDLLIGHQFSSAETTLLILVTIFFVCFGIFGNTLIIVSILVEKKLRSRCNVFVITLAMADGVIQGYILPFTLADFLQGQYPVNKYWCRINAFLVSYCYGVSLWSITFIGINRYVKICHPQKYEVWLSKRNTCLALILLFFIPVPMNTAPFLGWGQRGYDRALRLCVYLRSGGQSFTFMQMVISVIIPATAILLCYAKIFAKVRQSQRNVRRVVPNPASSFTVRKYSRNDVITAYSLFVVFIVLVCLMLPFTVTTIGDVDDTWSRGVHMAGKYLAYANSWVNFIIYGVMNGNFRQTYKRLLCSCWNKHNFRGNSTS